MYIKQKSTKCPFSSTPCELMDRKLLFNVTFLLNDTISDTKTQWEGLLVVVQDKKDKVKSFQILSLGVISNRYPETMILCLFKSRSEQCECCLRCSIHTHCHVRVVNSY